jgi:hypothetical protein
MVEFSVGHFRDLAVEVTPGTSQHLSLTNGCCECFLDLLNTLNQFLVLLLFERQRRLNIVRLSGGIFLAQELDNLIALLCQWGG